MFLKSSVRGGTTIQGEELSRSRSSGPALPLLTLTAVLSAATVAHAQLPASSPPKDANQPRADAQAPDRLVAAAGPENSIVIPRLAHAPKLEDFLTMAPPGEVAPQKAKIHSLIQP